MKINNRLFGVILLIFLLAFSVGGLATDYKFTQESGTGFFVASPDKSDALEDTNEVRQIVNDIGTLLQHTKMDGTYPKDLTTGGTLSKFDLYYLITETNTLDKWEAIWSKDVTDSDELAAALTDYYLKTAINTQAKMEAIWGVALVNDGDLAGYQPLDTALTNLSGLTYVSPSFIKLTADDTFAVRTLTEVKTDLSLNLVENLKVKLNATAAPAVTNDTDEGYAVGSRWVDVTNDKEYVCLDNTDGAAVWTETTGAGGGASTFLDLTDTPAAYDDGKYAKSTAAGIVFDTPAGAGNVANTGTPVIYDYARFTDATTIEGRSYTEMKTDLAYQLSDLSDVNTSTPTNRFVLIADGTDFESRALVEADISDLGTYLTDITGESILSLSDVAADPNADKYLMWDDSASTCTWQDAGAGGGYTNLTSFVDQTAWRLFYSNTDGDVTELALGTDGQVLTSAGVDIAPAFEDAAGGGDALTTDPLSQFAATTSAELAGVISNETGSGVLVFGTSPTFVTPLLGTPTSGVVTNLTGVFSGNLSMDHTLGSDEDYSGITDSAPVGETVAIGDLLYYDWTDVEWKKAKADAVGTTPAMRIALEVKDNGETCLMLVEGYIRDDSAFDFGAARVYLNDDTAGTCDDTAPAESGDQIQLVGIAVSADILWFNPSIDIGEI